MKKLLLTTFITTSMSLPLMAENLDIRVIGTISSAACTPSSVGGGVVDYGFISPNDLNDNGPTVLDAKIVQFTITCDAVANVALYTHSNRIGSTIDSSPEGITGSANVNAAVIAAGFNANMPLAQSVVTRPIAAGLGLANNKPIGGYSLSLPPSLVSLDGKPATKKLWIKTNPSLALAWGSESASTTSGDGHSLFNTVKTWYAYSSDSSSDKPTPFRELTGSLLIQAFITDKANLDLASPVYLDGSSTIELYYF